MDLAYYLRADEAQAACKGGEVVFSTDHVIEEKSALETRGKRFLCLNLVSLQRHYERRTCFDRHLYECLRTTIAYKPILDLDRKLRPGEELHQVQAEYTAVFVPLVVDYFSSVLGTAVTAGNIRCLDASLAGKKFSKHLIIHATTESGAVCAYTDRAHEAAVMQGFRLAAEERARGCGRLMAFLYFMHKGDIASVVDYAIYHAGKRDMRIIGSCKASEKSRTRGLRSLLPESGTGNRPLCHFLCNTFGAAGVAVCPPAGAICCARTKKRRRLDTAIKSPATDCTSSDTIAPRELQRALRELYHEAGGAPGTEPVFKTREGDGDDCSSVTIPINFATPVDGSDRRCAFAVAHSRHWAELRVNIRDTQAVCVDYYCHGCAHALPLFDARHGAFVRRRMQRYDDTAETRCLHLANAAAKEVHPISRRYLPPIDLMASRTLVIRSPMGSGKTHAIREALASLPAEASVLCIGYRRVLNTALAAAFGLQDYQQLAAAEVPLARRLCVQVDSLSKLLVQRGDDDTVRELRASFDVVIVDEAESTLDHFAADTLQHKVLVCWKLFAILIRNAGRLVLADADVGERVFALVQELRPRRGARVVLNTNSTAASLMCDNFVWLPSLQSFLAKVCDVLFSLAQPVYVASNSKAFAHALMALVLQHAEKRRLAGAGGAGFSRGDVLLVDRDIPEADKRLVRECNTHWLQYKLVICTPTVGAGIDFHVPGYFHTTFVYATDWSTTPREVNQQRGRVRSPQCKTCYVLVDMHYRKAQTECAEEALEVLERGGKAVVEDMAECAAEGTDTTWLGVRLTRTPRLLMRLLAMHIAERNASANNMAAELHKLLRSKCREATHVVLTGHVVGDTDNRAHAAVLRYRATTAAALSRQPVATEEDARELMSLVITAQDSSCVEAKLQLRMHFLRQFYRGLPDLSATEVMTIGHETYIKQVSYASALLAQSDPSSSGEADMWRPLTVEGVAGFSLAHRAALQRREPPRVTRAFFAILVFLGGMVVPNVSLSLAHGSGAMCRAFFQPGVQFHSAVASHRLALHAKEWGALCDKHGVTAGPRPSRQIGRLLRQEVAHVMGLRITALRVHKHYANPDNDSARLSTCSDYCSRGVLGHEALLGLLGAVRAHTAGTPAGWAAAGAVLRHLAAMKARSVECQVHGVGLAPRPAAKRSPSTDMANAVVSASPIAEWLRASVSTLRACSAALRTSPVNSK